MISFIKGFTFIFLALLAYFNVLWLSSRVTWDGLILAIITKLLFPSRESFNSKVNFESLYLTLFFFPVPLFSARAFMQFARARSDLLIFAPSIKRAPRFDVADALSDPARSIRDNLDSTTLSFPSCDRYVWQIFSCNIA